MAAAETTPLSARAHPLASVFATFEPGHATAQYPLTWFAPSIQLALGRQEAFLEVPDAVRATLSPEEQAILCAGSAPSDDAGPDGDSAPVTPRTPRTPIPMHRQVSFEADVSGTDISVTPASILSSSKWLEGLSPAGLISLFALYDLDLTLAIDMLTEKLQDPRVLPDGRHSLHIALDQLLARTVGAGHLDAARLLLVRHRHSRKYVPGLFERLLIADMKSFVADVLRQDSGAAAAVGVGATPPADSRWSARTNKYGRVFFLDAQTGFRTWICPWGAANAPSGEKVASSSDEAGAASAPAGEATKSPAAAAAGAPTNAPVHPLALELVHATRVWSGQAVALRRGPEALPALSPSLDLNARRRLMLAPSSSDSDSSEGSVKSSTFPPRSGTPPPILESAVGDPPDAMASPYMEEADGGGVVIHEVGPQEPPAEDTPSAAGDDLEDPSSPDSDLVSPSLEDVGESAEAGVVIEVGPREELEVPPSPAAVARAPSDGLLEDIMADPLTISRAMPLRKKKNQGSCFWRLFCCKKWYLRRKLNQRLPARRRGSSGDLGITRRRSSSGDLGITRRRSSSDDLGITTQLPMPASITMVAMAGDYDGVTMTGTSRTPKEISGRLPGMRGGRDTGDDSSSDDDNYNGPVSGRRAVSRHEDILSAPTSPLKPASGPGSPRIDGADSAPAGPTLSQRARLRRLLLSRVLWPLLATLIAASIATSLREWKDDVPIDFESWFSDTDTTTFFGDNAHAQLGLILGFVVGFRVQRAFERFTEGVHLFERMMTSLHRFSFVCSSLGSSALVPSVGAEELERHLPRGKGAVAPQSRLRTLERLVQETHRMALIALACALRDLKRGELIHAGGLFSMEQGGSLLDERLTAQGLTKREKAEFHILGAHHTNAVAGVERVHLVFSWARRLVHSTVARLAAGGAAAAGAAGDAATTEADAHLDCFVDSWLQARAISFARDTESYRILLSFMLWVFCTSLPFVLVDSFGRATILPALAISAVFFGMNETASILDNPFGRDVDALDLDAQYDQFEAALGQRARISQVQASMVTLFGVGSESAVWGADAVAPAAENIDSLSCGPGGLFFAQDPAVAVRGDWHDAALGAPIGSRFMPRRRLVRNVDQLPISENIEGFLG